MLSKEEAHQATGMKVSEIVAIEEEPPGYRVTTHDGQAVYVHSPQAPVASRPPVAELDGDPTPEPEEEADPAPGEEDGVEEKAARAPRGRSRKVP